MSLRFLRVVLALLAAPLGAQAPLAITHVTVVDVERGRSLPDRTVVIAGARIREIARGTSAGVPVGARVVDGRGKFLIPGLWDMHIHVVDVDAPGPPAVSLPLLLATGVTGVRDVGSVNLDSILLLRDEIRAGRLSGPRMVVAGALIDGVPSVYPPATIAARSPDDGRRVVDSLARRGVDLIKPYEMLRRDTFLAILDEARRQGLRTAGHVSLTVDPAEASDSGLGSLEHLRNIDLACSSRADSLRAARTATLDSMAGYRGGSSAGTAVWSLGYGAGEKVRGDIHAAQRPVALATYDPARCSALVRRLARNHTWVTPTLRIQSRAQTRFDTTGRVRETFRYVPPSFRERWARAAAAFEAMPATRLASARRWEAWEFSLVRRLADAGVGLLAGTDVSTPFMVPGFSLHEELRALVEQGGLTPLEALRSATLGPARWLGATDSLGTVAAGKLADLVLLDADPLRDVRNTTRVRAVLAGGRLLDRAALDSLLAAAERAAVSAPPR